MMIQLVYMAVLIGLRPYAETNEQKLEVKNELDCLLVLYFLILFTGKFIQDPFLREKVGEVLIGS